MQITRFRSPLKAIPGALIGVSLLGKAQVEEASVLTRLQPGACSQRQNEVLQIFADQAVIAIEIVRPFDQVQPRTRDIAASLNDLRRTQDRLVQPERLASPGQLATGIVRKIKNPLDFVNIFAALSRELLGELADLLKVAPLDPKTRDEANELLEMVDGNLSAVATHRQRADSIVKKHAAAFARRIRRASVNINGMVEESLNLAYHGARAKRPGLNVTLEKGLDPNAGAANLYAQEMTRVLLNLIGNGLYASAKQRQEQGGAFKPILTASTRDPDDKVEIAIRDNGTGIPDDVNAKLFNPFFTDNPAGEGTGLGLPLSHDLVVNQHCGTLEVAAEPGAYLHFAIVLLRANGRTP